jgi:hypothetical protein
MPTQLGIYLYNMATIPSGQKFHTVPSNVQTAERGSALANSQREIYTMQDIIDTVPAGAAVNPTSGKLPYNNAGVFADSAITNDTANKRNVSNFNYRINRLTADGASKLDLFTDANSGSTSVTGGTGIQWGVTNFNPGLGITNFNDCSIVVDTASANAFGSPLYFKTQNQISLAVPSSDTQVTKLSIIPGNFITQIGGIGVQTESPNCAFHVLQSGSRPSWQSNNAIARFEWNMGGVVFPNVTTSNRGMMAPEFGMVIYNSTTNKLQVWNGAWVDLH